MKLKKRMEDIKMSDCNFAYDEEKRTVVCWMTQTEDRIIDFFEDNDIFVFYGDEHTKYKMKNRYEGKAVCSVDDEWNPEVGAHIAFYRAKRAMLNDFYRCIRVYFDEKEAELDKFEDACIQYRDNVERSLAKHKEYLND